MTLLRRDMLKWLEGPGKVFRHPLPGRTNYLGAYDSRTGKPLRQPEGNENDVVPFSRETRSELKPFPKNDAFRSQSVLSEETREEVYQLVAEQKLDLTSVSATYGIDLRRVAAIVRLKTIEKQWKEQGLPLAKPYNDAVLGMLPKTSLTNDRGQIVHHEGINDVPVHPATRQQIFFPTSESRQFTREDAAKAFAPKLLPPDKRIAHPVLLELEKWNLQGMSREDRMKLVRERDVETRRATEEKARKRQAWEERTQKVVPGRRFDFKFQDISVEAAGRDGRGKDGVGLRYGMPHEDRKRGIIKIPTSVE